jgi:hypothetical protein
MEGHVIRPVRGPCVQPRDRLSATYKSAFLREQLGNSHPRSGRVVGCRFVFAAEN